MKPSTTRIGVCLTLGVMTTIIVAWVLAIGVVVPVSPNARSVNEGTYRGIDGGRWWYQVYERPGLTVVTRERGRRGLVDLYGKPTPGYYFEWRRRGVPDGMPVVIGAAIGRTNDIPSWARQPGHDPAAKGYVVTAASARGWPCHALWYEASMSRGARVNRGGIDLPQSFRDIGPGPVLPYRLIPLGFVADTASFAVAWMVLMAVPDLVRRARRRRGGLCRECGYDLRHAGHDRCPECGAATGVDERTPLAVVWRRWASRSTSP